MGTKQSRRTAGVAAKNLTSLAAFHALKTMEVELTPDQKVFVRQAIESGRLHDEPEAVQEALALWEERERTRATIVAAVDEAEASLAKGEGRIITQQAMRDRAGEVKQRGRDRLAAERTRAR
jgi:putative addiction module CopG family antidote